MKSIAVVTTPRTGSNLLCDSLAQHSQARGAGEWFNPIVPDYAKQNKLEPDAINYCNIFKLFTWQSNLPDYAKIIDKSFVVFLYREDIDAQLISWELACKTGKWVEEGPIGNFYEFDPESRSYVERMNKETPSDLRIAYEDLVSKWEETLSNILSGAGWSIEPLEPYRRKLSNPPNLLASRTSETSP